MKNERNAREQGKVTMTWAKGSRGQTQPAHIPKGEVAIISCCDFSLFPQ